MQIFTAEQREGMREAIKFNTELIKIFSIIAIALATGVSSLTFKLFEKQSTHLIVMIILGSIHLFTFVIAAIFLVSDTMKKIKSIK